MNPTKANFSPSYMASNRVLFGLAQRVLGRNEQFAGRHEGKSYYVLGNGASIKQYDLKKLALWSCVNLFTVYKAYSLGHK
jgi:hypothetical protein